MFRKISLVALSALTAALIVAATSSSTAQAHPQAQATAAATTAPGKSHYVGFLPPAYTSPGTASRSSSRYIGRPLLSGMARAGSMPRC